jgi:hypothetical protein
VYNNRRGIPGANLPHWNNHCAGAVILYATLASNNGRVGDTHVDKDVSERGLEPSRSFATNELFPGIPAF